MQTVAGRFQAGLTLLSRVSAAGILRVLAWLPGLLLACMMPPALAHDGIVEQAWIEDPSRRMGVDEVRRQSPRPFEGVLSLGYGDAPVWVRLRIAAETGTGAAGKAAPHYLRVQPAYLDDIRLYDPLQGADPLPPLGDRHPLSFQAEPSLMFVWRLPGADRPRDIWVRLEATSTRSVLFEVLDERSLRLSNAKIDQYSGIYLGLMLIFCVWAAMHFALRRDMLVGSFLLYATQTFCFGAGMLGYTRFHAPAWVPPVWIDRFTSMMVLTSCWAVLMFSRRLLREISPPQWWLWTGRLMMLLYPVLVFLLLSGHVRLALELNMLLLFAGQPSMLVAALAGRNRPANSGDAVYAPSRKIVAGYLAITTIFTLMTAAPAMGWVRGNQTSLYIVLLYSCCTGLLITVMLQYRAHRMILGQKALAQEALFQQQQAQEERRQRMEREQLLDMLGHELKTPLAEVRMIAADRAMPMDLSERIDFAAQDMTMVLERALKMGQLEDGRLSPQQCPVDLAAIVDRVIHGLNWRDRVNLEIVTPDDAPLAPAVSDPALIAVIIRNLIDNAAKYSPKNTNIDIRLDLSKLKEFWSFTVKNKSGRAGFPDENKIFQKYYRSPSASFKSGSGLGLYLSHEIAKNIGGILKYYNVDDEICFELTVPNFIKGLQP